MTKNEVKNSGQLVIYAGQKGLVELRADTDKETIWATLDQVANLFDVQKAAVSKHFKNIFESGELSREATVSILETVQTEGNRQVKRQIEFYNLDAVIAVGYRVNSKKATQFRIWATKILREYLMKGFVVNLDRVKKLPDRIISDLASKVSFIQRILEKRDLDAGEAGGILSVIRDYAGSWTYLKEYDEGELKLKRSKGKDVMVALTTNLLA